MVWDTNADALVTQQCEPVERIEGGAGILREPLHALPGKHRLDGDRDSARKTSVEPRMTAAPPRPPPSERSRDRHADQRPTDFMVPMSTLRYNCDVPEWLAQPPPTRRLRSQCHQDFTARKQCQLLNHFLISPLTTLSSVRYTV